MSPAPLCTCGLPLATCPHLGVFDSSEYGATHEERLHAKRAFYVARVPALRAALDELSALATRADAKRAIELARIGAEHVAVLPIGADASAALAFVLAALAKAALLAGLA